MAEGIPDLRHMAKPAAYAEAQGHFSAIMAGVNDSIAAMATMSALLYHGFGHLWTGFYRVVDPGKLLRVGPYQGTLGCLEIPFGNGVCGWAAAELRSIVVPDVHVFPGHITCDPRSMSEIVVPVFGPNRVLIAVLDIDSERLETFDDQDQEYLELLVRWFEVDRSEAHHHA